MPTTRACLLAACVALGIGTQAAANAAEPTCKFLNVSIADHGSPSPAELGQVDAVVRAAIAAQHDKNADAFPAHGVFGMMKGGGLGTVGYSKEDYANQPKTFQDCLDACYDDCRCLGFHWSGKHARCGLKAEGDIAVSTDNRYQKTFRSFKRIMTQGCTPASASATTGAADTTTTTTTEPTTTSSTTAEPTTTTTSISYTLIGQGLCADASGNLTRSYRMLGPALTQTQLDECLRMCSELGPRCVGFVNSTGFVELDTRSRRDVQQTPFSGCFLFGSQLPPTSDMGWPITNGTGGSDNITTISPTDPFKDQDSDVNITSIECYAK